MARNSNLPAKMYSSGERTATTLRYFVDVDDGSPDHNHAFYIDLAQSLSVVNQRAYRQGLYYYVAKVTVVNSADARIIFSTVPDTWTVKESWKRGFRTWSKMNSMATQSTGSIYPAYHDYKVFMDSVQVTKATTAAATVDHGDDRDGETTPADNIIITPGNLLPCSYDRLNEDSQSAMPTPLTCDEWAMSLYVVPDHGTLGGSVEGPDIFGAHIVGAHDGDSTPWTSVGLVQSYTNTRPFTGGSTAGENPKLETTDLVWVDPLVQVLDYGDTHEEIVKDLADTNDTAPYEVGRPFGYDDHQLMQVTQTKTQAAGAGSTITLPGFCLPFGLLRIDTDASDNTAIEIILDVVPGSYHGVHAERVI